MDDIYKIIDTRESGEFKMKSFSGYKRRDVFDALDKSILSKKIENACNWVCECICSGYIDKTWQHLITIASNVVNINNPTLSNFLYKKNVLFYNVYNNSKCKIELRNNSTIRNLMFGITVVLALSDKTKRYDKYPKLKDIDFDFSKIQTKLIATSNLLNCDFIRFNEPAELKLIFNELYFHLKKLDGYGKCIYWILWVIEWEHRNIKCGNKWTIEPRKVDVKHDTDLMWIIWECLLLDLKDTNKRRQVLSLYEIFKHNYSPKKRKSRLPLVLHAVSIITHQINYSIPLIRDKSIYIQTQCYVNKVFETKKIHEVNNIVKEKLSKYATEPRKPKQVEKQLQKEMLKNKLDLFNELDFNL